MKKIKDRKIRRSNIPDEQIIFQVVERFQHKNIIILVFGLILLFFKLSPIIIIFLLSLVYLILSLGDKLIFELRSNFMLYFIDKTYAKVIYYNDIINYRFNELTKSEVELVVLTIDEEENKFILPDLKIVEALDIVIGDKRVGK